MPQHTPRERSKRKRRVSAARKKTRGVRFESIGRMRRR